MLKAALITLLVGVANQAGAMQPICKNDGLYQEGYCYWFAPLKVHGSWSEAGRDCRHLSPNTHLYRPSSQQQQDDVIMLLKSQYNISLPSNWLWAIDYNKLLDGVQWLNTDFSVPKYNTINDESDALCGVLEYSGNNTMKQKQIDCAANGIKAICQKKVCHHDNTDQPQCGAAPHINNTIVRYMYNEGASSGHPEGTVAIYECLDGFEPHGVENVTTCLNNTTWSPTDFSCAAPACCDGWTRHEDLCYIELMSIINPSSVLEQTQSGAVANCESVGGGLIRAATNSSHNFITSQFISTPSKAYWLDLTDLESTDGNHVYSDGSTPTDYQWDAGEPDGGSEHCVDIAWGAWNDDECSTRKLVMCERASYSTCT